MKNLLNIAINEIGVKEIKGTRHNERILKYAKESGFNVNDDETAWCSIFMNWVAKKAGLKHSKSAAARSWLTVGEIVDENPEPGDVVIYYRESRHSWKGHVGIFIGYSKDGTRIYTLGGNQRDSVSISAYSAEKLLGFRRLKPSRKPRLPKPILKRGSKGTDVMKLQDILKLLGYKPGTSDGDFGPKTESALMLLQSTNRDTNINGIYNEETRDYIDDLIENKD
ncbi:MAG: TIGR02594 family protein [Flavobacteriaceae bacterium]